MSQETPELFTGKQDARAESSNDDRTRTRAVGDWRAESWRGTTDRGSQHRTPETVAEKRGSSHSEEN